MASIPFAEVARVRAGLMNGIDGVVLYTPADKWPLAAYPVQEVLHLPAPALDEDHRLTKEFRMTRVTLAARRKPEEEFECFIFARVEDGKFCAETVLLLFVLKCLGNIVLHFLHINCSKSGHFLGVGDEQAAKNLVGPLSKVLNLKAEDQEKVYEELVDSFPEGNCAFSVG